VKSTRVSWSDFRRQWKKDRRFYGWGRDDREREKRFRAFLKELGESTRSAIFCCAPDELDLFQESVHSPRKRRLTFSHFSERVALQKTAPYGRRQVSLSIYNSLAFVTLFVQVKKTISEDPRYDAVGSSSLREELFNTFLNAKPNQTVSDQHEKQVADTSPAERGDEPQKREDRKVQAVKEREEKIKVERERVQATIEMSRIGLNREEGELQFRCAAATFSRFCGSCASAQGVFSYLAGPF
jgi:FF domain